MLVRNIMLWCFWSLKKDLILNVESEINVRKFTRGLTKPIVATVVIAQLFLENLTDLYSLTEYFLKNYNYHILNFFSLKPLRFVIFEHLLINFDQFIHIYLVFNKITILVLILLSFTWVTSKFHFLLSILCFHQFSLIANTHKKVTQELAEVLEMKQVCVNKEI